MMPRILMFGWEFPPWNSGGLGVACFGLTRALSREGAEIAFVLPTRLPIQLSYMRFIFADGARIKRENISLFSAYGSKTYRHTRRKSDASHTSLYGITLFDEVERYRKAAKHIAKEEIFEVIHAHDWLTFPAGIEAKRVSGKPLLVHVHATEFDRCGGENVNQEVYAIERQGMEEADAVFAVSNFTKRTITARYGIPENKVHVVWNGIEADEHHAFAAEDLPLEKLKRAGTQIVLFVGRLTLQKGPDYFIRVAKQVLEYAPNTLFLVTGSGDMKREVVREAAALGIAERVLFTGFLRGEELDKIYQAADVLLMPSVSEPFGIVALEALVNGTPAVLSKQSGVSERLRHALKVDFWDVAETANKIIAMLRYASLRACLAEEGGKEARQCNWQESARECMRVYDGCIAERT